MSPARKNSAMDALGLIACLVIALGLRLIVILNQPAQLTIDRDAYLGIANSIAEDRGFSSPNSTTPTAFRPPLYPLILATGLHWFTPEFVVASVNLICGLLTVWLTVSLGRRLKLGSLRFFAALLVAIDPLLLQYSSQPMTESLCTFLATLWVWSLTPKSTNDWRPLTGNIPSIEVSRKVARWNFLIGVCRGIAFGMLVLSRPTFWVIAFIFCIKDLIPGVRRNDLQESQRQSAIFNRIGSIIGTAFLASPWLIRNWLVMGVPILATTHGGYTLLLSNNPVFYSQVVSQPWGTTWPDASQQDWYAKLESEMAIDLGPHASEVDRDYWQSHLAKTYIIQEPWHCIEASFHRFRSLWNTIPQSDGIPRTTAVAVGWFYATLFSFGLIGFVIAANHQGRTAWFPSMILIFSIQAVHLLYWTNTRMRAPMTPVIALLAVVPFAYGRTCFGRTLTGKVTRTQPFSNDHETSTIGNDAARLID